MLKRSIMCDKFGYSASGEQCSAYIVQGSRIRFVLGCVIPRAGAVARSRNLGQTLFGSPVEPFYWILLEIRKFSQGSVGTLDSSGSSIPIPNVKFMNFFLSARKTIISVELAKYIQPKLKKIAKATSSVGRWPYGI